MSNKRALQNATKELTKAKAPSKPRDIIYDPRGQWNHPGQNTRIPGGNITMQGVPYPVYAQPNVGQPQMMYPGQDYQFPGADYVDEYPQMQFGGEDIPVIEDAGSYNEEGFWVPDWESMKAQAKELNAKTVKTKNGSMIYFDDNWNVQSVDDNPQMKKGGYTRGLVPMPKPSKKGLASKAYSRSLDATNRLFTENTLFKKPKDRKRKVFDPNAKYYQDGGEYGMPLGAGVSQNFIGNRDEFNVGGIPELPLRDNRVNYDAYVNRFEPKDEYEDGGYIETELTDEEIQAYKDGGYIVEDISIPSLNQYQDGGVYTFEERPDSKYKKDSKGNWLISNPSTKGKYVPIKDPSGSRTKTLNRWAEGEDFKKDYQKKTQEYDQSQADKLAKQVKTFEEGIDYSAMPSETLNQVAGNYLGNFGQKSKNLFSDAQNKKAVLKNVKKDEELQKKERAKRDEVTNLVLDEKNLTVKQKKELLNDPQALGQLSSEYQDFLKDRRMGTPTSWASPGNFHVLPNNKQEVNLSEAFPDIKNISKEMGYALPSVMPEPEMKVISRPVKLSHFTPSEKPRQLASGRAGTLDSYYLPILMGGLALPEVFGAANAIADFAPISSLPSVNLGNALTAKGVYDAGTKYIPNSIDAFQKGQREGWSTQNAANFGYNALKSGLSLVPLSQTLSKVNAVKNAKNAFNLGDASTKLARNPTDPSAHFTAIRSFGSLVGQKYGGQPKHVDTELTDAEIQDLIDDGYIVELL